MNTTVQVAWGLQAQLGEGPVWHAASGRFFFVDIHGCAVHAWNPVSGACQSWACPERVCWLIPRSDGDGWLAGRQSGFYRLWLDGPTPAWQYLPSPHPREGDVRLNDAKADPWGRVWAGSMNNADPRRPDGALYCVEPDGAVHCVERGMHIANGPAIAPDGSWMLHTDSLRNTVYRYRLDDQGLHDKTPWRCFTEAEGTPDGMTFDADGQVWIAFWGGACVRQLDAQAHTLQCVPVPALQVTSVTFGGADLRTLCITSARTGLADDLLAQQPSNGALFLLAGAAQGLAACGWGGNKGDRICA